jgi:hypothetical protein
MSSAKGNGDIIGVGLLILILCCALAILIGGCADVQVFRLGRTPLGGGPDRMVDVRECPKGIFLPAMMVMDAGILNTKERREKHLRRKGGLLGCDFICNLRHHKTSSRAWCARYTL